MSILPKQKNGCPYLILAPMEGVGDQWFRKAIATIGGFDEAVRDFLRVPLNAHVESLAVRYESDELAPIPLAAQIMGSDLDLMAAMAVEMQKRGAPRIDLNCGCPSNTVTGRGAGSSLLKDPDFLYQVAKAIVEAVSIPVTAKLRSGFNDIGLFRENMLAAEASGISFLTLHPRTKVDGYGPPARWDLIREAKSLLKIPIVGNGDILTVADAKRMLSETGCDALMIGRGSVINPFIFHQIKADYDNTEYLMQWAQVEGYFNTFLAQMPSEVPERTRVNKVKQLMSFMFKGNDTLLAMRQNILTWTGGSVMAFMDFAMPQLKRGLFEASP